MTSIQLPGKTAQLKDYRTKEPVRVCPREPERTPDAPPHFLERIQTTSFSQAILFI